LINYQGIAAQMAGQEPTGPVDLAATISDDLFQAIGDRLRAEGKIRPFREIQWHLLYDQEGDLIGKVERQRDGSWEGVIILEGQLLPVTRATDDAPFVVGQPLPENA
jgi:hypothetical protein